MLEQVKQTLYLLKNQIQILTVSITSLGAGYNIKIMCRITKRKQPQDCKVMDNMCNTYQLWKRSFGRKSVLVRIKITAAVRLKPILG